MVLKQKLGNAKWILNDIVWFKKERKRKERIGIKVILYFNLFNKNKI